MPTASSPSRPRTPEAPQPRLAAGTLVRILHNEGLFRIAAPAESGHDEHSGPRHYDVSSPSGRLHRMVPAERITVHSTAQPGAIRSYSAAPAWCTDPVERMLKKPAATMAMARRLLSPRFLAAHSLTKIAVDLAPRYFETHCHRCAREINNLDHPACPKCEGILCKCGACRCNWPFPSSGVHGVAGPRLNRPFSHHYSSRS